MKQRFRLSLPSTWLLSVFAVIGLMLSTMAIPSRAAPSAASSPIKIGFSVSLSGDFSGDGKAILQGYRLWAKYVNSHGGLLGHKVDLIWYDDASSTTQVATNYTKLFTSDKVNLAFGPFSSLLTIPAGRVAQRYGYAFLGPAGGGPTVFQQGFKNYFFVQPAPVKDNLVSFGKWILSLPKSKRPKTAAYVTLDDPFATPEIQTAKSFLHNQGLRSVYSVVIPSEATDFQSEALSTVRSKAQIVLIGSPGANLAIAMIHNFIQQHYNPKAIVATSGPDQGAQFANAIGRKNTEGIMVPEGWWSGAKTYQAKLFLHLFLKTYHGTAADISQDSPEAFSVGQVMLEALKRIPHAASLINNPTAINAKLINVLHHGKFKTVQGPMRWNKLGEPQGEMFLVQWQHGNTIPVYPKKFAVAKPEYPKPKWH